MYGPLLVLLATFLNASTSEASSIVYFDTYRSLWAEGVLTENTNTGAWTSERPGGSSLASSFFSNISQSGISAAGNIAILSNTSGGPGDNKRIELSTSFEISVPYSVHLDFGNFATGSAYTEGFLFDELTQTTLAQRIGDGRLLYDGVLPPGIYSFSLLSEVSAPVGPYFGHGTFNGTLALEPFTPVPEPGTMTLFGAGLAATAWRRRKAVFRKAGGRSCL
jgi:hypothetical protein